MATMLHSESRRLYSWWWDSHNSPKNSKWLQENLTDMDAKVKTMIKLIEEDADSFARRAEMYYKKRPELMKLVEEFYRAYRALAERYDHATVDLRQAHRDLAQAFPNQLPPEISDDSSLETEPHTPDMPHPGRALFDPDESNVDAIGQSSSNSNSFEKNGRFSDEFNSGMKKRGVKQFNEMFGIEQSLHGGLAQQSKENQNLKIQVRSETDRASKTECDVQALRKTLDDIQSDREAVLLQYQQSLEKISSMENKIALSEDHAQILNERANIAETEVNRLRQAVVNSNDEKDDVALQYKECLETIVKLENEICCAQEDLKQLNDEIFIGTTKLKSSEEKVVMLEEKNQYLQSEVDNLMEKMLTKDQQLLKKNEEMGKLQSLLQDENSKLKEICKKEQYVNKAISEKLKTMEKRLEKNAALEDSLLDVRGELESSKEKIKSLQESFQVLQGENSTSVDEKNTLFSHLDEKIQKVWEKNTSLQNSLASANVELSGSREKSKCLEEICELLRNEKSNLLAEKGTLLTQLKSIEGMREKLEERFTELEENNMSLENDNKIMIRQVEELRFSLSVEKQEHTEFTKTSESRLRSVEKQVRLLEEENKLICKDFDAQLDEAMNAHVEIFILQKLIQDLEGKNLSLLNECQKYLEASQLSDKLISELEAENLEQNMESEFLFDEIEKLKKGISQMFKALKIDIGTCFEDKIELEHACLPLFLECVDKMKNSALENEDKRQRLEVLEAEKGNLLLKLENMQKSYLDLQSRNTRALEEKRFLLKKKSELNKKNCMVEDENEIILHENLTYNTLLLIFQNLGIEKGSELKTMRKIVETLEKECEDSKLMGNYQVNKVLELSEKNNNLTNEVKYLHEVNGKLESELSELHEEIEKHRIREKNLSSELKDKSNEFEIWEAEAASFYFDLQYSSTREVLLESKVHELTGVCESLEQESVSKSKEMEHMKEKLSLLENEVGGLKEELSAYVPLMVSLEDDIASLEHNALLRTKSDLTGIYESEDTKFDGAICENNCQELPENKATVNPNGISDLQMMRRKIKAVEKAVIEHIEGLTQEKSLQINIKPKAAMKEIESLKSKNTSTEKILPKENELIDETEISEVQNGTLMKDIPLDQVLDCAVSVIIRRRNVETDKQMLELWQTAEQNCTSTAIMKEFVNQEPSSMENDYMYNQFKNMNQINKDYPSSELEVEKVLGIDKVESSPSIRERTKEGHKRRVLEKLASDAQKLMSIQVLVQDLRKKTDPKSKKGKDVNKQLQEVKEYVVQLMDINGQMTKNIASPSFSESKEAGILHRMRVLEQARKGSEKIEKIELEVQKIQLNLEDRKKSKAINKFSKNTTSTAFRNFIHIGRRSGRKHKKGCLCGCLRPSTTETEVTLLGKMA